MSNSDLPVHKQNECSVDSTGFSEKKYIGEFHWRKGPRNKGGGMKKKRGYKWKGFNSHGGGLDRFHFFQEDFQLAIGFAKPEEAFVFRNVRLGKSWE